MFVAFLILIERSDSDLSWGGGQIHSPLASPSSSASLVNPAVRPEKPSTNLLISTFRDAPV